MLALEAYNISFSNLKSAPWRISQDDEDISRQHQAYRKLMWRKLISVFILLYSLAQSIKWHFQWITSLDLTFPSSHLSTPRTVRALYLVLLFSLSVGISSVCLTVSFYRCGLAPSSGKRFLYSWLAVRYTDCGCLDLRHLYCNINSSILQHQEILSLLSFQTYATPSVILNFSPLFGPH